MNKIYDIIDKLAVSDEAKRELYTALDEERTDDKRQERIDKLEDKVRDLEKQVATLTKKVFNIDSNNLKVFNIDSNNLSDDEIDDIIIASI